MVGNNPSFELGHSDECCNRCRLTWWACLFSWHHLSWCRNRRESNRAVEWNFADSGDWWIIVDCSECFKDCDPHSCFNSSNCKSSDDVERFAVAARQYFDRHSYQCCNRRRLTWWSSIFSWHDFSRCRNWRKPDRAVKWNFADPGDWRIVVDCSERGQVTNKSSICYGTNCKSSVTV